MSYPKVKTETFELLGGMNSKVSPYAQGPTEFRDLTNLNFQVVGALSKRQGSTLYVGATVSGRVTSVYEFKRLSGASYMIATANTNAYTVTSGFNAFKTGLLNAGIFDFVTFVDRLFGCNGQDFFKYDGSSDSLYSLPPGISGFGVTAVIGGGLSGVFTAGYGYLNDRGYFGPATGITISLNGATFGSIQYYGLTTPPSYGVTALSFYRTNAGGVDLTGTTFAPTGTTTVTDIGWSLSTRLANDYLWFTLAPRYLELYNNQLFLAGFSSLPSTAFWSDIGEPEGIDPAFNSEFRTNDGDRITGMKSFRGGLVVTKENSFHLVTGDNPDNFNFQEVSDQYGCVSNRAMVTFEDYLWALDPKGIVEYNGANIKIISEKMESVFASMNLSAARENAVALHVRDLAEVWFAIPCNGATLNNTVVVYDYNAQAWTKYSGVDVSAMALGTGRLSQEAVLFGGYTGNLFNFGQSFMGDNGAAITCSFDSRFLASMGQTTEAQYRRFYLNVDPIIGITQPITVNFRTNYGTSNVITRTMYQNPFQSRVDFGLPAKSIQAQVIHSSASLPCTIMGYAFESRYQRGT